MERGYLPLHSLYLLITAAPSCRWSDRFEKELVSSRVYTTRLLAVAIDSAEKPPKAFVPVSAIGKVTVPLPSHYSW